MSLADSSESENGIVESISAAPGRPRRLPEVTARNQSESPAKNLEKSRATASNGRDSPTRPEASRPRFSDVSRSRRSGDSTYSSVGGAGSHRYPVDEMSSRSLNRSGKTEQRRPGQTHAASFSGRSARIDFPACETLETLQKIRQAVDTKTIHKVLLQLEPEWATIPSAAALLLEIAASKGSRELIEWLRENGANFRQVNAYLAQENLVSPLVTATLFDHRRTAKLLAKLGLRCRLSELASASSEVLPTLLAISADVIRSSPENRAAVLHELVARKNRLAERPLEPNTPYFQRRITLEMMAEEQAVESFVLLSKAGALVTTRAMLEAIQGGQTQLAWAMLCDYRQKTPRDELWSRPEVGWGAIQVAISLGHIDHVVYFLSQKKDDSWRAPGAGEALRMAEKLELDDSYGNVKHAIFPPLPGEQFGAKLARRSQIHALLVNDQRLAELQYRLRERRERDYQPQYEKGRKQQKHESIQLSKS